MRLQTDRLTLIPMSEDDQKIFHETNNNHFVKKFLWDNAEVPLAVSSEIIKEVVKRFKEEKWGLWKIVDSASGKYIGYTGFWHFFDEEKPQLIYALLPEFTGNGYATEASKRMIKYAFENINFDHLIASTDKPNRASVNVLKRLDMKLVEEKEIEGKTVLFFRLENTAAEKGQAFVRNRS